MQLALLGMDETVLALARAAARGGLDEVSWVCGDEPPELLRLSPRALRGESWEALLLGRAADAVIVGTGGAPDERAEWLRKLVAAKVPTLVVPAAVDAMIVGYELEMIRRDVEGIIVPAWPARGHPLVSELAETFVRGERGTPGRVEQVIVQRSSVDATRERALAQFARDVDVLRALCGEVTRLSATAPEDAAARWSNLVVQLEFEGGIAARWTLDELPRGQRRITLKGSAGKATLAGQDGSFGSEHSFDSLQQARGESNEDRTDDEGTSWDPAAASLDALRRAVTGEPPPPSAPSWHDVCRALEITEAIERSLNRRRTIELPVEDYSVESSFKGAMAAVGCGTLMVAIVVLSIAALVDLFPGLRWLSYGLYMALAIACAVFVSAQLLRLVFPKR